MRPLLRIGRPAIAAALSLAIMIVLQTIFIHISTPDGKRESSELLVIFEGNLARLVRREALLWFLPTLLITMAFWELLAPRLKPESVRRIYSMNLLLLGTALVWLVLSLFMLPPELKEGSLYGAFGWLFVLFLHVLLYPVVRRLISPPVMPSEPVT